MHFKRNSEIAASKIRVEKSIQSCKVAPPFFSQSILIWQNIDRDNKYIRFRHQVLTAQSRIHRCLIRMNHLNITYARVFLKALLITSPNPQKNQSNDLSNSQNARNNTWITFLNPIYTNKNLVNINYICKCDKFQKAFVFTPN